MNYDRPRMMTCNYKSHVKVVVRISKLPDSSSSDLVYQPGSCGESGGVMLIY